MVEMVVESWYTAYIMLPTIPTKNKGIIGAYFWWAWWASRSLVGENYE